MASIEPGGKPPFPPRKKRKKRIKHDGGLTAYVRGVTPFRGLARKPAATVTGKQLIKMIQRQNEQEPCRHIQVEPHICPYLVEVCKDKRSKCRCCDDCQRWCADQI